MDWGVMDKKAHAATVARIQPMVKLEAPEHGGFGEGFDNLGVRGAEDGKNKHVDEDEITEGITISGEFFASTIQMDDGHMFVGQGRVIRGSVGRAYRIEPVVRMFTKEPLSRNASSRVYESLSLGGKHYHKQSSDPFQGYYLGPVKETYRQDGKVYDVFDRILSLEPEAANAKRGGASEEPEANKGRREIAFVEPEAGTAKRDKGKARASNHGNGGRHGKAQAW